MGAPIVVDGRVWGAIFVSSMQREPLPEDAESRIMGFTELMATAISNAVGRAGLVASRARIDGAGGADPSRGSGPIGLRDRVDAIGGTIVVESPLGAGTLLLIALPVE